MKKYLYLIKKAKIKSWLKFWLITNKQFTIVLSEILEGFSFNLQNTVKRYFKIFNIFGNSVQDGTPSPENPVTIESVADDVNLINESLVTGNENRGLTWKYDNNTKKIKIYGTANSTYSSYPSQACNIPAGTYKFILYGNTSLKYNLWLYDSDNQLIGNTFVNNPVTINKTAVRFSIFVEGLSSGTTYNDMMNFKLQKGTVATPYSPYNQGTVTIKQRGKNLFDTSNIISNVTDYTITVQDGGFIIRTGGMSNGTYFGLLKDLCPNLKVGDKFKFTWNSNATRNNTNVNYIYLNLYANTIVKDTLYTCTQTMLDSSVAFYGQEGEYYKDIIFYLDGQTSDYEPYQTPHDFTFQTEPLRSLPNGVRDSLEADGIHRRIRVLNLPIADMNNNEDYPGWTNVDQISLDYPNQSGNLGSLCKYISNIAPSNSAVAFNTLYNNKIIFLPKTFFNLTQSQWKEQYSDLVVQIQYELAEEIIEPYTEEQQEQYNKIKELYTFDGTTNIYSDDVVPPYLQIQYYMKGE